MLFRSVFYLNELPNFQSLPRFLRYCLERDRRQRFFDAIGIPNLPDDAGQTLLWQCMTVSINLFELKESEYVKEGLTLSDAGSELKAMADAIDMRRHGN